LASSASFAEVLDARPQDRAFRRVVAKGLEIGSTKRAHQLAVEEAPAGLGLPP